MDLSVLKRGVSRIYGFIPKFRRRTTTSNNGLEGVLSKDTVEALRSGMKDATQYSLHSARPTTEDIEVEFEWQDPNNFLLILEYEQQGQSIRLPYANICISPKKVSEIEGSRNNVPAVVKQAQDILSYYYKEMGFE